ncbi:hypothetical protein [Cloacibacillus evryensis]|uniref:hypothetical protein n=1 Tax=Cloacibacillus evryensis TaxID=508460 RepID=UPI0026DEE479|nr:hypothetical protein [Cloacibacillus evryensis]
MKDVVYSEKHFSEAWSEFASERADEAAAVLQYCTDSVKFQEYQKVLKEADDLMNILAGVLPKEKYTLLDQFDSAKNGVACFCADAAYEQGIKDAFAIMRSFIL